MAARTPVIATNEGGIPEVVENNISGFLTAHRDVDTMANYAIELLSDDNKLSQFKDAAFERAKTFDIQKIIPSYIDIYKKALQ